MRSLVDLMCGGIVSYLRMCGHDAAYAGDRDLEADDDLLAAADADGRTVITRDVALAQRAPESILLESRDVEAQLAELAAAGVELELADEPARCGACNGRLEGVSRSESTPEYAPDPAAVPDERDGDAGSETGIWRCRDCGRVFWKGSHWDRVAEALERVRAATGDDPRRNRSEPNGGTQHRTDEA